MPTAEAQIQTDRASRYLIQLCRHAEHMRAMRRVDHVDYSDTVGLVRFSDGELRLQATADDLTLRIEAADDNALQRLQDGIGDRLQKIGRRDQLTLTWHQVERRPDPPTEKHRPRRLLGIVALLGGGALIVALHLGLGGTALAATALTGWLGNTLLAIILAATVLIAAHLLVGRFVFRRGKRHSKERR
jgi:hypothetical protein